MKKALLLFPAFLGLCFLFSCKRSDVFGNIEPNTSRVVAEFTDAVNGTLVTREFSPDAIEVDLTELRLSSRTVTSHSTRVKVIVNPVVVSDYNALNGTSYVAASTSSFSLTNQYELGPEQRKVMVKATLRPSDFLDQSYAIGLSIAEMSDGDISPIAKHVIVFISIKNEYDGIYQLKGYSEVPGSGFTGHFSLPCSEELEVATSGNSSVYLLPSQPAYSSGGFAYITNLLPNITLDKTTGKVTSVKARSGGLELFFPYDATYNSRYEPATKTLYVKYGVEPAGSGRFIIDTLIFCKPR
ncbi:MAG TPA: DUF1735 domain-containing protein [Flavisolibacter sp.]|nr:DUF1735 domain-containing protein [Flavisolibacter sp.]